MTTTPCKRCGADIPGGPEAVQALQGMCTQCLLELGLEADSSVVITGAEPPAPPPSPEELQPLFPNHEILELLGQGGMGVVYRARQKGLDREVALKVLPAKAGRDPAFAERFTREAKALASLNHPNITSVFDFGKAGDHHYLAMELVQGVNLRQLLRTSKVAPKQALQIVEQVCDALQYAHDEGIVHRDIKPENILIDRRGRVKITDFGLAKLLGKDAGPASLGLTQTHQVMGTPHYMAPEQIEHPTDVDHRADIYSLGVVFYELLTGELPLGRFAPPSGKVQVDVKLDEVVLRALEKEPGRRYQTASAVKTDVHGIASPGSGAAAAAGGGRTSRTRRVGLGVGIAVGGLLLLVCGVAIAVLFVGHELGQRAEGGELAAARDFDVEALLRGKDLFSIDADAVGPSLHLAGAFGLSDEHRDAIATLMERAGDRYLALLGANTRSEVTGERSARVTLEAFPAERARLIADFEAELAQALPADVSAFVRSRGAVGAELFPEGDTAIVYELRGGKDGLAWSASTAAGALSAATDTRRAHVRRYWDHYFSTLMRPLGSSVLAPLQQVLAELQVLEAEGADVELSRLTLEETSRRSGADRIEAKVDLALRGVDAVRGTELLDRMLARLRTTGATGELGATKALPDGAGIQARDLRLVFPTQVAVLPGPGAAAPPADLSFALRSLAAEAGVGELDISMRNYGEGAGFHDVIYKVDFGATALSTQALLDWAQRVEASQGGPLVREVSLNRAKSAADRWAADVSVLVRHAD